MDGLSFFSHSLKANLIDEGLFNEQSLSISRFIYATWSKRKRIEIKVIHGFLPLFEKIDYKDDMPQPDM